MPSPTLPRRLLLATDLSGRCDRALDRAVELTGRWAAGLTAVHALERTAEFTQTRRAGFRQTSEDRAAMVARQLQADIRDDGVRAAVVVEEGNPADLVLQTAERQGVDLILTGLARAEPFGRLLVGATVERLLRRAGVPVLMVRNRVRGPYRNVVAATDFSRPSAVALATASAWFGEGRMTLLHAYEAPLAGLASGDQLRADWARMAETEAGEFLAGIDLPEPVRRELAVVIERGRPEGVLRDFVQQQAVDLVVLGRRGRNAVLDLLLGSTADALIDELPCDVMVVRDDGRHAIAVG